MLNNYIPIVFISDQGYAMPLCTALVSLKMNRIKESKYHIYILSKGIAEKDYPRLIGLQDDIFKIEMIDLQDHSYEYRNKNSYMVLNANDTALIKFEIPEILSQWDKILYLDCDIIIQKDLTELYHTDINDLYGAVVKDMPIVQNREWYPHFNGVDLPFESYFNSGVMLLNLEKMRADHITEQLVKYREQHVNIDMDQDAINVVFQGKVRYLSCQYNLITSCLENYPSSEIAAFYGLDKAKSKLQLIEEASILHFTLTKPWKQELPVYSDIFTRYYEKSPYGVMRIHMEVPIEYPWLFCYLFPFSKVPQGSKVVLYGAGRVGQMYNRQIRTSGYCKLVQWVDYNYKELQQSGLPVSQIKCIKDREYDLVVIAVEKADTVIKIQNVLINQGVDETKIIWVDPYLRPLYENSYEQLLADEGRCDG